MQTKINPLTAISQLEPLWLQGSLIMLGPAGSRAYGTDLSEADYDYRGIVIPPLAYHLGLKKFGDTNNTSSRSFKSTVDTVDVALGSLNKFVKDAMSGYPGAIELLFLPIQHFSLLTYEGEQLWHSRHLFLSKYLLNTYRGAAKSHMNQMLTGVEENDLYQSVGYNTKKFYHAARLLGAAIEIFETEDYCTQVSTDEKTSLVSFREGKLTLADAYTILSDLEDKLESAYGRTDLPDQVDTKLMNELMIDLNMSFLEIQHV